MVGVSDSAVDPSACARPAATVSTLKRGITGGNAAQFLLGNNGLDYQALAGPLQWYYNYGHTVRPAWQLA